MREILVGLFIFILCWTGISSTIYRLANPEKTEMQAFYHIPKSFVLNFKE